MRNEWRTIRLGDVFEPDNTRLGGHEDEPTVFSISKYDGVIPADKFFGKRVASAKLDTYKVLPVGGWAYSTIHIDEGSIARNTLDHEGVVSPMYTTLRWISRDHDPSFFQLLLREPAMLEMYRANAQGSINRRRSLPWKSFSSLDVVVPPLPEQRRIVDLIGSLDEAIEAAEQAEGAAFDSLDTYREEVIWGGGERTTLGTLCAIKSKLVDPTLESTRHLPHIGTDRIRSGTGDIEGVRSAVEDGVMSAKFQHSTDEVIYSKIRPNLRKVALPDAPGLCSADAYPLTPEPGVNREFLQQLLLTSTFTHAAVSRSGRTKMPKINKQELMSIAVPEISSEAQEKIAQVLSALDSARRSAAGYAVSLRTLRSNLLATLLSGEHKIPESYDTLLEAAA